MRSASSHVFGYHTSLMLGIATKSGDMKKVFESVAHLVERQSDFKKGLTSSLCFRYTAGPLLRRSVLCYVLLPKMMQCWGQGCKDSALTASL